MEVYRAIADPTRRTILDELVEREGLFEGAKVLRADKYGPGEAGEEGSVMLGIFEVAGQRVMCTDSIAPHDFDFTPSLSLCLDLQ